MQAGYLKQLRDLQRKHNNVPVVCAGDVFDTPHQSPELVNMVLEEAPHMYAVPGQHDLPYHRYEDIKKSAYWTLVKAGTVDTLLPSSFGSAICRVVGYEDRSRTTLALHGFPWGTDLTPLDRSPAKMSARNSDVFHLAVCHSYFYVAHSLAYKGAPESGYVSNLRSLLRTYDGVVFGDNHVPQSYEINLGWGRCGRLVTTVWNCGAFTTRATNEAALVKRAGLLMTDGTVLECRLDTSADRIVPQSGNAITTDCGLSDEMLEGVRAVEGVEVDRDEYRKLVNQLAKTAKACERVTKVIEDTFRGARADT